MAIAITDGYIDGGNQVGCKLQTSREALASRDGEEEEVIPFHMHCQKTICSAWQGGNGMTRYTLLPDNSGDLANI